MNNLPSPTGGGNTNLPPELRDDVRWRLARRACYAISFLLAALVLWASVAPIEEVAVAPGQVVPAESVSQVHHLEGGIIKEVLVEEGERVAQGQSLVMLRPELAGSDLGQLRARAANLKLKRVRLSALIGDSKPDFGKLGREYPALAEEQRAAYHEAAEQAREERREAEIAVKRLKRQIETARKEARSLRQQMVFQREQTKMREESHRKGYTSRHLLLQSRTALEETRQRLLSVEGRIAEALSRRAEARAKLRALRARQRSKWADARAEVNAKLSEVEETLKKYRDRVQRLAVTSPVEGVMQSLSYKSAGEVIKPGARVAEIVPAEGQVIAEVELQPSDIGHVSVGNPARITLSNYDPRAVGFLNGRVHDISPTTVEDKEGRFFYRVRIALKSQELKKDQIAYPLLPGMTLQAQIRTGSKTLARYMLKPVFQSFDTAFAER